MDAMKHPQLTGDAKMTDFNALGKVELRAACKEAGIKNYGKMNNDGMRAALSAAVAPAPRSIAAEALGKMAAPVTSPVKAGKAAPTIKAKRIEKDRESANGVTRPSVGTLCRQVWDFCDVVRENEGVAAVTAKAVKAAAEEFGWNANNASIEFYQWRKFNGIRGRQ